MSCNNCLQDSVTEKQEFEVYQDQDTMLYVARHQTHPVSSCGETPNEAVENAKDAVQMYDEPQGDNTPDYDL